jgi:hypothetical protein
MVKLLSFIGDVIKFVIYSFVTAIKFLIKYMGKLAAFIFSYLNPSNFREVWYNAGTWAYNTGFQIAKELSKIAGHPLSEGMEVVSNEKYEKIGIPYDVFALLPKKPNITVVANSTIPKELRAVFFPRPVAIPARTYYESPEDGYYNLFFEYFKNYTFLPDWFSEYIQIKGDYHINIEELQVIQVGLVIGVFTYMTMVSIRTTMYWWISINPYMFPFNYFTSMIDWAEESFAGLIPTLYGVDMFLTIFLSLIGLVGDQFNNLVFTMPFLPSEGKLVILQATDPDTKEKIESTALIFRRLPYLWIKHGIPNYIRQYWVFERPDIFMYVFNNYYSSELEIFPDGMSLEDRFIYLYVTFGARDPGIIFSFSQGKQYPPLKLAVILDHSLSWINHLIENHLVVLNFKLSLLQIFH